MRTTKALYTTLREKIPHPLLTTGQLPLFFTLLGLLMLAISLGSDLIGFGDQSGFGPKQIALLVAGGVVTAVAILADTFWGQRQVRDWFRTLPLDRVTLLKLASLIAQLSLMMLIIQQYHLENQALYEDIMPLAFYGFIIHYFLPPRYRLPFFLILSIGGIAGVLGWGNAAWLIGIGLLLIAAAHLPISLRARVGVLLVLGIGLGILRAGVIEAPMLTVIWPILGSMFMFRLIVYVYDISHGKEKFSLWRSLSYFFMLPNVVFPFFPIVDYSAFRRNYYDDEQHHIYQKGLEFMFLGVFHLILYRYINYYLVLSPAAVTDLGSLLRFLAANFILYFRVSGQFHLIIGMLHLFGFNLPETNRHYFLSSSFTDLWRRMNIYWKEFMQKVFYYPIYFRLRHLGPLTSVGIATFCVFVITWVLHSYQWFWLRGAPLISQTDIIFWTILGTLVILNSLYEAKFGRKRSLSKSTSWQDTARLGLGIVGTFGTMSVLWAMWTSPSVAEWWSLFTVVGKSLQAGNGLPQQMQNLSLLLVVGLLYEGSARLRTPRSAGGKLGSKKEKRPWFFPSALFTGSLILLLYLVGNPAVYTRLNNQTVQMVISDLRTTRLNDREAEQLERGYYENLNDVNGFNSQLWEVYMKRPADWPSLWDTEAVRLTHDFLKGEHVPVIGLTFRGQPYHTNRWGMRDQDYEQTPTPGTYRMAFIGSSHLEGWGVADGDMFESLLEERLNRESDGRTYQQYEILNFGMGAYTPPQELWLFQHTTLTFQPNAVFYFAHPQEGSRSMRHLSEMIRTGIELPYPFLQELVQKTGLSAAATETDATRELTPYEDDVVRWVYAEFVAAAQANGVVPVWVYLPAVPGIQEPEEEAKLTQMAADAGFIVFNLATVYDEHDRFAIRVAEWDLHPNAAGHQILADALYAELLRHTDVLPLGLPFAPPAN